jgi:hypothetical protein
MKYLLVPILLLCFFISGCKPGVPKNLIQPEEMGKILFDVHVVDSYLNTISDADSSRRIAASYYKGIYKKFDVDSVKYVKSMSYYAEHPDDLSKIYEGVTKDLTAQKNAVVKADSIQSVKLKKAAALKIKKDSLKLADSIKKFPAFRKKILLKKADSIKLISLKRKLQKQNRLLKHVDVSVNLPSTSISERLAQDRNG